MDRSPPWRPKVPDKALGPVPPPTELRGSTSVTERQALSHAGTGRVGRRGAGAPLLSVTQACQCGPGPMLLGSGLFFNSLGPLSGGHLRVTGGAHLTQCRSIAASEAAPSRRAAAMSTASPALRTKWTHSVAASAGPGLTRILFNTDGRKGSCAGLAGAWVVPHGPRPAALTECAMGRGP